MLAMEPMKGFLAQGGKTTVYVCERGLCHQPGADVATLKSQLAIVEPLP